MNINQLKRCAKTSFFQRIMFRIIRKITGVSTLPFVDTLFEKKITKNELFAVSNLKFFNKISKKTFVIFQLIETKIAKIQYIMSYTGV